jgi:hypothetical protein
LSWAPATLDTPSVVSLIDHYQKNTDPVNRALAHSEYNPFVQISDFLSTLYNDVSPYIGAAVDIAQVVAPLMLGGKNDPP